MANTTNYNWETPDDTDLVKDGAAAIRTLGSSIDTTTKNLNPSTTLGDIEYRSATANTNTRLGIGTSGQVLTVSAGVPSWATPGSGGFVGCALYKSGNQSIANATSTIVTWDSEDFDTDGFHSTVTNTERITIPAGKGGKYLVVWIIQFPANGNGQRSASLRKNGSGFLNYTNIPANSNAEIKMFGSFIANVVATDYFDISVFQDSAASQNVVGTAGYSAFQVQYLGA